MNRRSRLDDAQAFTEAWDARRAPQDGELAVLVRTAELLCAEAALVTPTDAFRTSLRARLMAEAAEVLVPLPTASRVSAPVVAPAATPVRPQGRRRLATVTAAVLASAGFVSLSATSASALPGDLLYPVKRAAENIELAFQRGDAAEGAFLLEVAGERLTEAKALAEENSSDARISAALEDFTSQADAGSDALLDDFASTRSDSSLTKVSDFSAESATDLSALAAVLPAENDAFRGASEIVSRLVGDVTDLGGTTLDLTGILGALTGTSSAQEPLGRPFQPAVTTTEKAESSAPVVAPQTVTAAPAPKPTTNQPLPLPTTPSLLPDLGTVTDPLVEGLLGGEDSVGLVPGLLNGLLGGLTGQ